MRFVKTLDVVRTRERVDGVRDAGFVRDDVLNRSAHTNRVLGRQRMGLVVQRSRHRFARATERAGERHHRQARDIVERLLQRERHRPRRGHDAYLERLGPVAPKRSRSMRAQSLR